MNELLLFIEIIAVFSMILVFKRFLGLGGLFTWIGIASVIANIEVIKNIEIFGISATLGNVMFASIFLATDIISESYGKEEAKKGVYIGLFSMVAYVICIQFSLFFKPSEIDIAHGAMVELFSFAPRIVFASFTMFFLANFANALLYNKLKEKFEGKKMWLRNNVCTIICNCLENFGMIFLAFYGIYPTKELVMMALSTCLLETIIAVCDTPFLYLSRRINRTN